MTSFPERADTTAPDGRSDDAPQEPAGQAAAMPGPEATSVLDTKPVLEWTREDWAAWIESGPAPDAEAGTSAAADSGGAEPSGLDEPATRDEESPVEGSPVEGSHAAETPAAAPPVEEQPVPEQPADETTAAEEPWWETLRGMAAPQPAAPPPAEAATTLLPAPPVEPVTAAAPATVVPPPAVRHEAARVEAPPEPAEPSEAWVRVRSGLGLFGVAVLVGAIVAGLVTLVVFALGLALRRALG
ncbi:MAG: hypothetical protein M3Q48_06310 [Actinomycetota bacterium]|nr:hypothetical protein [Actinomycetota bacterium]